MVGTVGRGGLTSAAPLGRIGPYLNKSHANGYCHLLCLAGCRRAILRDESARLRAAACIHALCETEADSIRAYVLIASLASWLQWSRWPDPAPISVFADADALVILGGGDSNRWQRGFDPAKAIRGLFHGAAPALTPSMVWMVQGMRARSWERVASRPGSHRVVLTALRHAGCAARVAPALGFFNLRGWKFGVRCSSCRHDPSPPQPPHACDPLDGW